MNNVHPKAKVRAFSTPITAIYSVFNNVLAFQIIIKIDYGWIYIYKFYYVLLDGIELFLKQSHFFFFKFSLVCSFPFILFPKLLKISTNFLVRFTLPWCRIFVIIYWIYTLWKNNTRFLHTLFRYWATFQTQQKGQY